jgi:hypothetical protein
MKKPTQAVKTTPTLIKEQGPMVPGAAKLIPSEKEKGRQQALLACSFASLTSWRLTLLARDFKFDILGSTHMQALHILFCSRTSLK